MMGLVTALYADSSGNIFDAPGYQAVGRSGCATVRLSADEMIPLPKGAELMFLPGRTALAARENKIEPLAGPLLAVAAMLPVGYTRTYLPAFHRQEGAPPLPLFGYTAVALYKDEMYVAAMQSAANDKWDPARYNTADLPRRIARVKKDLPNNRLVEHLAHCSLKWHCCTAQNLFYRRWEAGIPVSPVCNANCLGCISLQPAECCPAPQSRIAFHPTAEEVAEVGVYHLSGAPDAIISFGQGCEGEPALAAGTIAAAVRRIRARTGRGIININTNAGYTDGIAQIVDAGLNSMRVSIISARPDAYQAYYRAGYRLDDVKASIRYAKAKGVYVSLNMLLFPGFNDRPEEAAAWFDFLAETGVDMVQLRNLNLDPDLFLTAMPPSSAEPIGVRPFLAELAHRFPRLRLGSFTEYNFAKHK
ncbi:radical SAM protein [Thermosinus carboxydivorans]